MMDSLAQRLKSRQASLESVRATWETHWQEVIDFIYPLRDDVLSTGPRGAKRMDKIISSIPTHALLLCAAGLNGMITNPSVKWFALTVPKSTLNDADEVQVWLQEAERIIYATLNSGSNFNTEIQQYYLDYAALGTACLFADRGRSLGRTYFSSWPVTQIYVAENQYGRIDTLHRRFKLTARQCQQIWGARISDDVQRMASTDADKDREVEVLHCIYPRTDRVIGKKDAANMPFASVYIEFEKAHLLENSGYHEFPAMVSRWSQLGTETYGRGPGMTALADSKMLHELLKLTIRAAQKKVDPPLMVPSEGFLRPIRIAPASLNKYRGDLAMKDAIVPFPGAQDIGVGLDMIQAVENSIRSMFFNDMLQLVGGPNMTATEVLQRTEEKLRILGPVMGRIQDELLSPLLDRVFGLLWRDGQIPPPPQSLAGERLEIQYVSPLARAQKLSEIQGIVQTLQIVQPLAAINPDVLDVFNFDAIAEHVAEIHGMPEKLLRQDKEMEVLRQQRQEASQAQQVMAALDQGGKLLGPMSKAIEPGSAAALLGMTGKGTEPEDDYGLDEEELNEPTLQ